MRHCTVFEGLTLVTEMLPFLGGVLSPVKCQGMSLLMPSGLV